VAILGDFKARCREPAGWSFDYNKGKAEIIREHQEP
jgi:hypothetical protein